MHYRPRLERSFVLALLLTVVMMGCDLFSGAERASSLRIETDRSRYSLSRDTTIDVHIRNVSERTVYYRRCLGKSLKAFKNGRVVHTIGIPVCFCGCPAELKPGEKVASDVSRVPIPITTEEFNQLPKGDSVSYRLEYAFYRDESRQERLPPEKRWSNRFTLQFP